MQLNTILSLGGGLGLFLFGMKLMGDGLEQLAGNRLRSLLRTLTNNRFLGMLVGCVFTMIIQSSSATTVMVVGFVNARLMNLMQAAGVIMGANIGTTITGQLIAFNLTAVAPVLLLVGVCILLFSNRQTTQRVGTVIAGFGILFVGMDMMSDSMVPLRTMPEFIGFMSYFDNPMVAILTGMLVTAVIQSSSATIGIILALASQGVIGLYESMYVVLGINVGTCVTTLLSCIGTSKTAKRAAIIHLEFNVISGLLMFFMVTFLPFEQWMVALAPDDLARQIANVHTVFNIIGVVVLLPMANILVRLSERIVPGMDPGEEEMRLKYADDLLLQTPPIAVSQICREVDRMYQLARENLELAIDEFAHTSEKKRADIAHTERIINYLNHEITRYLVKLVQLELLPEDAELTGSLFHVINDIERVGDHAENITEFTNECIRMDVRLSEVGIAEIREMFALIQEMLELSAQALTKREGKLTGPVLQLEEKVDEEAKILRQRHIERLSQGKCQPLASTIFNDILSNLERVADHANNITQSIGQTIKE